MLHLYRRFAPDFTGDGIYYERLIELAAEHNDSEHEVLVFDAPAGNASHRRDRPLQPRIVHYLTNRESKGTYWGLFAWIARHIRRFDLLHIHTHVDRHFLTYLLARVLGCKVIYSSTLEDSIPDLVQTYRPLFRPIARAYFSRLDAIIGISPRLYSGGRGIARRRAFFVPQGVQVTPMLPPAMRAALRERLGVAPDEVVLLYVGSLIARKGVAFLLEQFARLRAQHAGIRLFLVGPIIEPDYGAGILNFIATHGLTASVTHVPFTERPQDYYDAADIFVFASFSEGFGNVLLEAMSRGVPVVSRFLQGVTTTFIDHGINGYLFSEANDFRASATRLITDPARRAEMGEEARRTVAEHYDIAGIADRLFAIYRGVAAGRAPSPVSDPLPQQCSDMAAGPLAVGMRPIRRAPGPPVLSLVIDTESEFRWSEGVSDDKGSVESVAQLNRVQDVCDPLGARICYVVDYPVATDPSSVAILRDLLARGGEIGVHMQPWTTPPVVEPLGGDLAFPGNLPHALERLKLQHLRDTIETNFNVVPRVYKAGRYGISAGTLRTLEALGFDVDLSVTPGFDYGAEGGPDFSRFSSEPYWFGERRRLLELPTTSGFVGFLAPIARALWSVSEGPLARRLHLRGLLGHVGALSRLRLSPEGFGIEQLIRLTEHLRRQGCRHFSLSFHSSTLLGGYTPYSATAKDVDAMLLTIGDYLRYFANDLGGRFDTPTRIYDAELRRG